MLFEAASEKLGAFNVVDGYLNSLFKKRWTITLKTPHEVEILNAHTTDAKMSKETTENNVFVLNSTMKGSASSVLGK